MSHGPRHADIVAALAKAIPSVSGNLVHDLHTVALMREHEITTIYTRDTGFKLFTGIQAVDPLAPA